MIFLGQLFRLSLLVGFLLFIGGACLIRSAEKSFRDARENLPYDAIIVPGYPFPDSTWNALMKARIYWSKFLYEQHYTNNIIYSGAAVYTPFVESKIMKAYGVALGIPADHIFVDTMARHSTENLFYSYQLAQRHGFEKIALATDPFQNAMLRRYAKKMDMEIDFLPIAFGVLKEVEQLDPVIDPSFAYVEDFVPLPEKIGFFKRLKGTLGRNIDRNAYQ